MAKKKESLKEKVLAVLEEIRPQIQSHGGDIALVKAQDGQVVIKIMGACIGCPLAQTTFDAGLETAIKERVPEVKEVKFIS